MNPSDDWAQKRAEEIKAQRKQRQVDQENFNKQQEFMSGHAQVFWKDLKEACKNEMAKFNSAMGQNELRYQEQSQIGEQIQIAVISSHTSTSLTLDDVTFEIRAQGQSTATFNPSISRNPDKYVLIYHDAEGNYQNPKSIAMRIVQDLADSIE